MATINQGGVKKIRVLVESRIVVEPGYVPHYVRLGGEEKIAKWKREWCTEFLEFVRDHRQQDVNSVTVEEVYEQQCSKCGQVWEEMTDDDGVTCCASCCEPMEIVT